MYAAPAQINGPAALKQFIVVSSYFLQRRSCGLVYKIPAIVDLDLHGYPKPAYDDPRKCIDPLFDSQPQGHTASDLWLYGSAELL